jgi:pilus assembly protein CpaC
MAGLAGAALLCAGQPVLAAETPAYDMANSHELVIAAGKSQVLELPSPYTDLMVADPKIADVVPLTSRSVYIVGKAPGSTALTIYGQGKQLIAAANVVVSSDIEGLKARMAEVLPREKGISVRPANQSLVLSGTVSSPSALQQALALAETYAPTKVVNMLGVEGTQQVMLSVRFVEMQRNVAKNLRSNVNGLGASSEDPIVSVFTGDTNFAGFAAETFGSVSALFNNNLELMLDAMEQKGLLRTLAEPTLVAMSGDTANFLAGGEYPIPVAQATGANGVPTLTIEFKQFGVSLAFTPTILQDGLVNMIVTPEVSSIDPTVSIDFGTIRVPGLKVRRAKTTVEMRDGESFTIAGLMKDEYQSQVRQMPFVGDIPILGALFRSTGYKHDETELVIVVTPHIVTPRRGEIAMPGGRWIPPSDLEMFLLGRQSGDAKSLRPEDRVLLTADPKAMGVEGPHGHVLY